METTIKKGNLEITATDLGAEPVSVKYKGKERLWQNENGSWAGHAPVLFPVCGACEMRVGSKIFPCPRHGFALYSPFTLAERTDSSLKFRLVSDEKTKALYPYDFVLDVEYEINEDSLKIIYRVYNPQEREIYFSCGGHDSFSLDGEPKNYELVFEKSERFESLLVDESGYLTGKTQYLGEGRILNLSTELLENSNSVCLDKLNSREVLLREKGTGKAVVKVSFPQTEKLVLWRPDKAKMLCIEPWQNLPDVKGSIAEFSGKDGIIAVAPFGRTSIFRTIKYY